MRRFIVFAGLWLLCLVGCAVAAAVSFVYLDVRVADYFWGIGRHLRPLGTAFGAAVILSLESTVALGLIFARVVRGRISRFGETLAIACLASICAYGVNSQVLKPVFGVPPPDQVIAGAGHACHWLLGSGLSSFPSGHMVLAGSFAGAFMRLRRGTVWPLSVLLVLIASLLVVGGWHFLSDVIAGAFVGVSAGILAGEAWAVHSGEIGRV